MSDSRPAPDRNDRPLLRQFDQRLSELIATTAGADGNKRPGYARLAKEIRDTTGRTISGTYLWELATGKKRNVTLEQLDVLAEFFGVPPEYFLDDETGRRIDDRRRLAIALRDAKVRNLALRADGLSPDCLDALIAMVNEARKTQNLSSIDDDDDTATTLTSSG
ncbi:hypothetical protein ABZ419_29300 [Streptomyces cinnamoneus]|uniref:hypothetical protein n=1 Tax=Streptomyces cinnamoneus TaxID=53446 RepID=UPI0033D3FCF2